MEGPSASRKAPARDDRHLEHPVRDWINDNGKRVQDPTSTKTSSSPGPFAPDASVVLVGIRGAGKSTLAIIASTAMKRRVADAEKTFQQATGFTSSRYKKLYGPTDCHRRQADILSDLLTQHPRDAIIVCSWMEPAIQAQLRAFSATNPVIHLLRDSRAICDHLRLQDMDRARSLLAVSNAVFRSCSNYEFFNLSENPSITAGSIDCVLTARSPAPYLTLKLVERHFLKFLSLVMPAGSIPFIESAFPLTSIPTETRSFTYATSVNLSAFADESDEDVTSGVDIEALETGADAIEVVIDDLAELGLDDFVAGTAHFNSVRTTHITRVIGLLRRSTVLPIIYHVVAPHDIASLGPTVQRLYLEYIEHGFRLSPEYVTVDLGLEDTDLLSLLAGKRRSRIIAHRSWSRPKARVDGETVKNEEGETDSRQAPPSWADPIWVRSYQRAQGLGVDLVRFMRPAVTMEDNIDVQRFRLSLSTQDGPKIPIVAYNSGRLGRTSACFNPILTTVSPVCREGTNTPNGRRDGQRPENYVFEGGTELEENQYSLAPCISAFQATKALFASFVFDPMELYVFGANVGYSLSPAMHNAAFRACGIPHYYRPISTDSLSDIKALVTSPRFAGASVGLPFKVPVISLAHALSAHARAIGAVNTLIPIRRRLSPKVPTYERNTGDNDSIDDDRLLSPESLFAGANRCGPVTALYGENTDWIGIRDCIRRGLSPANAVRPSSCGTVIGAGGMARAAVYAMLQLGVENVVVVNRTLAHAENLVEHFTRVLSSRRGLPPLNSVSSTPASTTAPFNGTTTGTNTPTKTQDSSFVKSFTARFHIVKELSDPWPDTFRLPTIIVSCIPTHSIGDTPAPNFTVPQAWLDSPTGGVVVDLGYKTLHTPLLEQARSEAHRGWVTMDGLDLLPAQGFAQFELFTGRRAPRRLMRREVFQAYPPDEQGQYDLEQLQPRLQNIVEQEL